MNQPRTTDDDYINFLLASPSRFTCTEAARSQPGRVNTPSHDSFTRLLLRTPQDTEALWTEAEPMVKKNASALVLDDTTLDKPYSQKMALVTNHWSGKHHRVVRGINLITLLWTDGEKLVPTDFRIYDKPFGGKSKNGHFVDMLLEARERGINPDYVIFDSWYSSLDNLKLITGMGWHWFTRFKENRLVGTDGGASYRPVGEVEKPEQGMMADLKGYGAAKIFRTVREDGEIRYWATDDLTMDAKKRDELESTGWGIEVYHRGIKQCCGIEKAQARREEAQRAHILLSMRAFLRLEANRLVMAVSWYEAKLSIVRGAIRAFLAHPTIKLVPNA
jgi:putative transposase